MTTHPGFFRLIKIMAAVVLSLGPWLTMAYPVKAAEFLSGDQVEIKTDRSLRNAYIAGNQVVVKSQTVDGDLVVAGQTVVIDSAINGGLIAAGSEITVNNEVKGSIRAAGAKVVINGTVDQDVVLFGSEVTISEKAVVNGDVVFAGGILTSHGTIKGKLTTACDCQVTVDGALGSFDGQQVGALTITNKATIEGNVAYRSNSQAKIDSAAQIKGSVDSQPVYGNNEGQRTFLLSSFVYGLIASLVFCLVLAYFGRRVVERGIAEVKQSLGKVAAMSLVGLVVWPVVATLALLPSVWLGGVLWLLYLVVLGISYFMGQLILGWWLLQWWYGRTNQGYDFDWRAPVIGSVVTSIILLVPAIGVIIMLIMFMIGLGALTQTLTKLRA